MLFLKAMLSGMSALLMFAAFMLPPSPALAQRAPVPMAAVAAPRIDGFDVDQVKALVAGTELDFILHGTPGGMVTVTIDGAAGRFLLEESDAGVYEGTYTIRGRDRVTAGATVTANLRLGNQVASAILDESLLSGSASRSERVAAAASAAPRIDRFDVDPPSQLAAGNELYFTLAGSPAGRASVRIAGVKGKFFLEEMKNGIYEGAYTIKDRDRIASDTTVTATLNLGNRVASATLNRPLLAGPSYSPAAKRVARACASCGVIEAVNVVKVNGDGSYIGKIGGGLVGGLLGSQIGHGSGTTIATVIGAVGGAVAGNEIEKRVKKTSHYEVVVRLQGGGAQTVSYAAQPAFKVGDKVRLENGVLVAEL